MKYYLYFAFIYAVVLSSASASASHRELSHDEPSCASSVAELAQKTDTFNRLLADKGELDRIMADGADRAREVAQKTMARVRAATGF